MSQHMKSNFTLIFVKILFKVLFHTSLEGRYLFYGFWKFSRSPALQVKNSPSMRETWVWSLGWEDPLEKGKATHFSSLAGEFHGLYSPWGRKESDITERLSLSLFMHLNEVPNSHPIWLSSPAVIGLISASKISTNMNHKLFSVTPPEHIG